MRKITILLIALMVISVGFLSGCNEELNGEESNDDEELNGEESNDDEEFIRMARTIIKNFYPVSCNSLSYDSSKTLTYTVELNRYELSSSFNIIRTFLLNALERIDYAYESYLKYDSGCDSFSARAGISQANSNFETADMLLSPYE